MQSTSENASLLFILNDKHYPITSCCIENIGLTRSYFAKLSLLVSEDISVRRLLSQPAWLKLNLKQETWYFFGLIAACRYETHHRYFDKTRLQLSLVSELYSKTMQHPLALSLKGSHSDIIKAILHQVGLKEENILLSLSQRQTIPLALNVPCAYQSLHQWLTDHHIAYAYELSTMDKRIRFTDSDKIEVFNVLPKERITSTCLVQTQTLTKLTVRIKDWMMNPSDGIFFLKQKWRLDNIKLEYNEKGLSTDMTFMPLAIDTSIEKVKHHTQPTFQLGVIHEIKNKQESIKLNALEPLSHSEPIKMLKASPCANGHHGIQLDFSPRSPVLIASLNNETQPLIRLGGLYGDKVQSPVTKSNYGSHLFKTANQSELNMNDDKDHASLTLKTAQDHALLQLSQQHQSIRFSSAKGELRCHSGSHFLLNAKQTLELNSQNTWQIKCRSLHLKAKEKISWLAQKSGQLSLSDSCHIDTLACTLKAHHRIKISTHGNTILKSQRCHFDGNSTHLEASAIHIKADTITLKCHDSIMQLSDKTLNITAPTIRFNTPITRQFAAKLVISTVAPK